jgi:hypothetical protein
MRNGGDRFASRKAWRLAYNSQRVGRRDRPFEKLFRLQRKLGCEQGWDSFIRRRKGMWHRTFERHVERYEDLDEECGAEMAMLVRVWATGSRELNKIEGNIDSGSLPRRTSQFQKLSSFQ